MPVAVITGGGGLGKTSLAVAAAHHVSGEFPDGNLFVDLHGMDAATRDPAEVLRQWLVDLGIPADAVPVDAEARQARFRSLTHAKRLLVVIDNARNAAGAASAAGLARLRCPGHQPVPGWPTCRLPPGSAPSTPRSGCRHWPG